MNPSENSATPFSALEISGAVSARVLHDLSNLLSGIVGNAEYAAKIAAGYPDILKVIQSISVSANSAGRLLGQCLPLQQALSKSTFAMDVGELAGQLADASGLAPGWKAIRAEAGALSGQVRVQPRWLIALVWQIARETQAQRGGEADFACGPAEFPVVWHGPNPNPGTQLRLFQINLRYRSDQMLVSEECPLTPERPGLLAAFELIKRFKGQIQSRPKPPGRQEISILLPLL